MPIGAGGWPLIAHGVARVTRESRWGPDVIKIALITLALVCVSSSALAADPPKSSDQANLQGVWLAQSESQNGQRKSVAYQYVFKGDEVTFTDETGKEMKYSFQLDTAGDL